MKRALHCWSCGAPYREADRSVSQRRCVRCGIQEQLLASPGAVGVLIRERDSGPEVLLVCRKKSATYGGGLWCLPGAQLVWGEEVRETARRAVREQTGLRVDLGECLDSLTNYVLDDCTVMSYFLAKSKTERPMQPVKGPNVDHVEFFAFDKLPDLAFSSDELILTKCERRFEKTESRAEVPDNAQFVPIIEAKNFELRGQLNKRSKQYDQLMDLYMQELMRGAWINDLLVKVASTNGVQDITELTTNHLNTQSDLGLVRVWLPGPSDRCENCHWALQCPKTHCLHLTAEHGEKLFSPESHYERIPPIPGTPAGDTLVRGEPLTMEVKRPHAQPSHFDGFPLDIGEDIPGVLGVYGLEPREAGERRSFQLVARATSGAIKNSRLTQELKRSDQVKRIFIDKMSHELKTPLTVVLGYAELLKEDLTSEGDTYGAECAEAIEKSGRDLATLVESILFITKLESGRLVPKSQRCDVDAIIRKVIDKKTSEASNKGLKIFFESRKEPAWTDPEWLERIMEELLSNAIKFTREGQITVRLEMGLDDKVMIHLADTGIGLSMTNRSRIFEPFTQGTRVEDDYQTNLQYGGLGVGLAIARTLVEQSGGELWVESTPQVGSRFSFTLPSKASKEALTSAKDPG